MFSKGEDRNWAFLFVYGNLNVKQKINQALAINTKKKVKDDSDYGPQTNYKEYR